MYILVSLEQKKLNKNVLLGQKNTLMQQKCVLLGLEQEKCNKKLYY